MRKHPLYILMLLVITLALVGCSTANSTPVTAPNETTISEGNTQLTETEPATVPEETTPVMETEFVAVTEPSDDQDSPESPTSQAISYTQHIKRADQPIYAGPSYDHPPTGTVKERGTYTIVDEATDEFGHLWGKLKSGIGWVNLSEIQSADYESALMSANYAEGKLMPQGAYHHYSCDRDCRIPLVFWAYANLRDVTFFTMEFVDVDYVPGEDFFTLPEMTPEKPLVVELDFPGDMSMYGLRFTDEDGITHTFHIFDNLAYHRLVFTEI